MPGGPFNPLAVSPLMGLLLGLSWPVWASEVKVELSTAVQSEGGGDALRDDRTAERRTAVQMEPDLSWRRKSPGLVLAASLGPAVELPRRRSGNALSALRGTGEARFIPSRRTLLETGLRMGYAAFGERSPWEGRWRLSGELKGGFAISESLFLNAGYSYARSIYSSGASGNPLPTPSAKAAGSADHGRAWGRQRRELSEGEEEEAEPVEPVSAPIDPAAAGLVDPVSSPMYSAAAGLVDPVPAPVTPSEVLSPQGEAAPLTLALPERREKRHSIQAGLTWAGLRTWMSSSAEMIQNRSSLPGYGYRSFQVGAESGVQLGPVEVALQGSDERRQYDHGGGAPSSAWRFIWVSARATCQLQPWLNAFGEFQREYGLQGGSRAFAPWSFAGVGLRAALPLGKNEFRPEPAAELMRPHSTGKGWLFRLAAPGARSVYLIGTFCGWDRRAHPLHPGEKEGVWEVVVPLGPGTYEYTFLVDGRDLVTPPQAPMYVDDGFGQRNGVLVVEAAK